MSRRKFELSGIELIRAILFIGFENLLVKNKRRLSVWFVSAQRPFHQVRQLKPYFCARTPSGWWSRIRFVSIPSGVGAEPNTGTLNCHLTVANAQITSISQFTRLLIFLDDHIIAEIHRYFSIGGGLRSPPPRCSKNISQSRGPKGA